MAVEEARLEEVGSGLAPVSPGWFLVNVGEAAWIRNDAFGGRCVFEGSPRVLAERPDAEPQRFEQIGYTLAVLEPGKPSGMYHAESGQEDFLVLAGECLLIDRGGGAAAPRLGLRPLPARDASLLRRRRRGSVRDLHGRRSLGGRHDRLPGVSGRAGARRGRRAGDADAVRGLRAFSALAARPPDAWAGLPWETLGR
jgi:hypothetical protein